MRLQDVATTKRSWTGECLPAALPLIFHIPFLSRLLILANTALLRRMWKTVEGEAVRPTVALIVSNTQDFVLSAGSWCGHCGSKMYCSLK